MLRLISLIVFQCIFLDIAYCDFKVVLQSDKTLGGILFHKGAYLYFKKQQDYKDSLLPRSFNYDSKGVEVSGMYFKRGYFYPESCEFPMEGGALAIESKFKNFTLPKGCFIEFPCSRKIFRFCRCGEMALKSETWLTSSTDEYDHDICLTTDKNFEPFAGLLLKSRDKKMKKYEGTYYRFDVSGIEKTDISKIHLSKVRQTGFNKLTYKDTLYRLKKAVKIKGTMWNADTNFIFDKDGNIMAIRSYKSQSYKGKNYSNGVLIYFNGHGFNKKLKEEIITPDMPEFNAEGQPI